MTLSPLYLEIALHYHTRAIDMDSQRLASPAVGEAIKALIRAGMLEDVSNDTSFPHRKYKPTQRLDAWVKALLTVPFPKQQWVVEWPKEQSR